MWVGGWVSVQQSCFGDHDLTPSPYFVFDTTRLLALTACGVSVQHSPLLVHHIKMIDQDYPTYHPSRNPGLDSTQSSPWCVANWHNVYQISIQVEPDAMKAVNKFHS